MIILRYKTSYWIPPIAEVTLRTQLNEWKDLPGRYEDGGWTFELPEAIYAGTWAGKLVLDRAVWMNDPNLTVTVAEGQTQDILPAAVVFDDQRRGPVREYGQLQRRYFEPPIAPNGSTLRRDCDRFRHRRRDSGGRGFRSGASRAGAGGGRFALSLRMWQISPGGIGSTATG